MKKRLSTTLALFALFAIVAAPVLAAEGQFSVEGWLADWRQIRMAMSQNYANFEWAVFEREIDLSKVFSDTERRLRNASNDQDAEAIIDRSLRAIGDGHLRVRWPSHASPVDASATLDKAGICRSLGYDANMSGRALGPHIPGYRPLPNDLAPEFPAGIVNSGATKIGVIRIGLFAPQGYPELCHSMIERVATANHSNCDQQCADRLESLEYAAMSRDLALRVRELKRLGSDLLLVDVSDNGGGSEWAEAAARIVSPIGLRAERRLGVRGAHWADHWASLARDLREAKISASATDARRLEAWAQQVDQARSEASSPCSADAFWSGRHPDCGWLAPAFYATGLLAEADVKDLRKTEWGPLVFSPAQFDYEESVWRGPLVVLVDGGTGSAAGEFAAVLQDNGAAIIAGSPAESGCGHTNGGIPTALANSHGILELPDCVRLRLDGTNDMGGIDPDVLIGFHANDGMRKRGLRVPAALPRAASLAVQLCKRKHCTGAPQR